MSNSTSENSRLETPGLIDPGFSIAPPANQAVNTVAATAGATFYFGGAFSEIGGRPCPAHVARTDNAGRVEPGYPQAGVFTWGAVSAFAFTSSGVVFADVEKVGRIRPDGSVDQDFGQQVNALHLLDVRKIVALGSGGILVAGQYNLPGDTNRRHGLIRLQNNGGLDPTFAPVATDGSITSVAVANKIVIAGGFFHVNGAPHSTVALLELDGRVVAEFTPAIDTVAVAVFADPGIVVGGGFSRVNGAPRPHLARVDFEGRLIPGFLSNPSDGPASAVDLLASIPGGDFLVFGRFRFYSGVRQREFARIRSNGTLDRSLPADGLEDVLVRDVAVLSARQALVVGSRRGVGFAARINLRLPTSGETFASPEDAVDFPANAAGPLPDRSTGKKS